MPKVGYHRIGASPRAGRVLRGLALAALLLGAAAPAQASSPTQSAPAKTARASVAPAPSTGGFKLIGTNGFGDPHNSYSWAMGWFKGKLYVGTDRDMMCVHDALAPAGPWVEHIAGCLPPQIKRGSGRFKQLLKAFDLRAQIWAYTPETGQWAMVYQSPMMTLNTTVVRTAPPPRQEASGGGQVSGGSDSGSAVPTPTPAPQRMVRDQLQIKRQIPLANGFRAMGVYTDIYDQTALYVGGENFANQAPLLRTVDGIHFQVVGTPGLGLQVQSYRDIVSYKGHLFISALGQDERKGFMKRWIRKGCLHANTDSGPCMRHDVVYVSDDPGSGQWTAGSTHGFGDPLNKEVYSLTVCNGALWAGVNNSRGFQVWKTTALGTPPYSWTRLIDNGAGVGNSATAVTGMGCFNNALYVGSSTKPSRGKSGKSVPAAEIVRVNPDDSVQVVVGDKTTLNDGTVSNPLMPSGFRNKLNTYMWRLAAHDGWLYAGTYDRSTAQCFTDGTGTSGVGTTSSKAAAKRKVALACKGAGFDLFKTSDGVNWVPVTRVGFGNPYAYGVRGLIDTPIGLALGTASPYTFAPRDQGGTQVWLLPGSAPALGTSVRTARAHAPRRAPPAPITATSGVTSTTNLTPTLSITSTTSVTSTPGVTSSVGAGQ